MALRDQPYIPLYVQDVLTDEKLIECSAESHGVYFRLLCMLHKQETYGKIELKAKYKQNESNMLDFAKMLERQMPFDAGIIYKSLQELIEEKVLFIEGDFLCQKRMLKDYDLSEKRAIAGAAGGKKGRNSGTKRYYNEPGYLYLIYDKDDNTAFKVGISAEPDKRIKGIMRKTGRNNLMFRRKWQVSDMGESEQLVLDYYDDIRDGEWIFGDFKIEDLENQINQILTKSKPKANQKQTKSKPKANTEYENEYEYEYENEIDIDKKKEESEEKKDLPAQTKKPTYASLFDKVLKEEGIQLPEGFYEIILEWLKYKAEKGQTYKETGLKNLIIKLMNDSGGNYEAARAMIFYSVSNNYAGLFKDKANGTRKTIAPATDIEIADILLKHFGDE